MRLLEAIDRLDGHIHAAPEARLCVDKLLDPALLRASVGVIRVEADKQFPDERRGAVGELFQRLEELEAFEAAAKKVTFGDEVRIDLDGFYERLDALRRTVPAALAEGSDVAWAPLLEQILAFEQRVDDADRTLITRRVKLDPGELRDRTARLRLASTQAFGPPDGHGGPLSKLYAALDTLDEIAATGDKTHHPASLYGLTYELRDAVVAAGAPA